MSDTTDETDEPSTDSRPADVGDQITAQLHDQRRDIKRRKY